MKRLPKAKRNQLVGVAALTLLAVAGLWFWLVNAQQQNLRALATRHAEAAQRFEMVKKTIADGPTIAERLGDRSRLLDECETDMASGDLYSWIINTLRDFKANYQVEIPQFSQIDGPKNSNLLPNFPYKQATITIGGTAKFYDFGRFVADFENQFPYMRLLNLTLEPASGNPAGSEMLAFRMDVVTLVKPPNS